MLLISLAYGACRLHQSDFATGPRLALIQGNMPQYIRNDPGEDNRIKTHFCDLAAKAAESHPDLIVWSETSWPYEWTRIAPTAPTESITEEWQSLDRLTTNDIRIIPNHVPNLLGTTSYILESDGPHRFNSA